jgi:hypothetical protein
VSGSNGPPRRFRISLVAGVTAKTEQLIREAEQSGRGVEFATALKRILSTLRTRPREFGEPLFGFKHAQMEVRVGIWAPAAVRYAVHRTADEVLVIGIELLSAK